ncbi:type I methionyl aminopeptidase [bacterium (Candidatus Gribaldobacteria) CG_4_8_14_3_um_filter_42_11]|uniref:Methionine aminopeptidase n=1 Tax=bacterium (Candidatus Gribaldobacteria) CG_4_8_14_3_um_filter_42_11 TaxID=2014267 RepID=A0A2M7IYS4_9BACT|nr:MAG: type I methionyl aminopeptidase [bacterium (Candidatus Gribaldobacteria) CG_4_8_14_3_um_filter_42_11]
MISIKTDKEIAIMKQGGAILARVMKQLLKMAKPGASGEQLNRAALALFFDYGVEPAFLGHQNFPAALCVSKNKVVVHGLPDSQSLKSGDILSLDLGLKYQGYYLDMAFSVIVGKKSEAHPLAIKFLQAGEESLKQAIKMAKPGNTLGDLGQATQEVIERAGFSVVRNLCGHGIGQELHEDPQILNYGLSGEGEVLKEGMVICLEPMLTMGGWKIKKSADGFGYETADGSLACHFEHTIAVAKKGPQVLTKF